MRSIKKTIAVILCVLIAASSLVFAEEVQLISVKVKDYEGHWAQATIEKWMNEGKVSGYPDGSYKPDNNVTRAEFVKMVNGIIDFNKKANLAFKDVPATEWYHEYISVAQEIGYISGYSAEKFGPNDYITREQAASILSRIQYLENNVKGLDKFSDKDKISTWATGTVGAASEAGFISGYEDGSFKPLKNLSRAEALTMIDNVLVNGKNVVVYNDKAQLNNMQIKGDLIIAKTVGEGDVYLSNLGIEGQVKVFGGGINSVYFNNVKIAKIIVEKDKVRLVFDEGSKVEDVVISSQAELVNKDGSIAKVTVTGDNAVILSGNYDEVTISGKANVILDDAKITQLIIEQPIIIQGTGTIGTLQANANGITYEADVEIDKTVVGTGVTEKPEVIIDAPGGGGGGGGFPPADPTYRISVSAVIDGTTYEPLFTTSTTTGTDNISVFLRDQVVDILGTNDSDIDGYFNKLNSKISNLKISGIQVNTEDGLDKIQEKLAGTSILNGFVDGIFTDGKLSKDELKKILKAYTISDLDKFGAVDIENTLTYGDSDVTPTFKFDSTVYNRTDFRAKMIEEANKTINQFFVDNGKSVIIQSISNINGVDKVTSFTINKVD